MSTVYLFYKAFCILKIKVALISCRWSKALSKAGENNGLIRPPAESVPGLNNIENSPISLPSGVGVETQTPLASPLGSELVRVIRLTPCSAYAASWETNTHLMGLFWFSTVVLCKWACAILTPYELFVEQFVKADNKGNQSAELLSCLCSWFPFTKGQSCGKRLFPCYDIIMVATNMSNMFNTLMIWNSNDIGWLIKMHFFNAFDHQIIGYIFQIRQSLSKAELWTAITLS